MRMGEKLKSIAFTKASACGNDFLILRESDLPREVVGDVGAFSRRLCDRHNGIGADGVEWLYEDAETDARVRLINADGSEAEISGNGTRCVAAEICARRAKTEVAIRTGAGVKVCRLVERRGASFEFESEMGAAAVEEQLAVETALGRAMGTRVSTGNPHFVIFVDKFAEGWQREAALIQQQAQFPQGTNVEYVVVRGKNEIEIRLFERGVGETLSSGTGSCASAVAAVAAQRVASPVTVVAPGGAQVVRWECGPSHNQVYLRGPAALVCRGEFLL